jgi:hypothetical protein
LLLFPPIMQLASDTHIKDDLGGAMSVKFLPGNDFNDYCIKHIENYDPLRFEILAIRVFFGKETLITLYAVDKDRKEKSLGDITRIPVKKFKATLPFLKDLLPFIEECNFTLSTGKYHLAEMEVINT